MVDGDQHYVYADIGSNRTDVVYVPFQGTNISIAAHAVRTYTSSFVYQRNGRRSDQGIQENSIVQLE